MAFTCLVVVQFLLLVTGVFSMNETIHPWEIGNCSLLLTGGYFKQAKQCQTNFVKTLQGNKNANCSVTFSEFVDCQTAFTMKCLRANLTDPTSNVTEKWLKETENSFRNGTKQLEGMFCDNGAFTYTNQLEKLSNITAECGSDFLSNANKCAKPFNDQFKDDWTNIKLCRLYAEGHLCVKKLYESKCRFSASTMEAVSSEYKKHYNPWCPNNKDPKDFFEGYSAAGTLFSYGTFLVATAVGACGVVLMSP